VPKFFADGKNISAGRIVIDGDDALHIKNSLRLGVGDGITVCDGNRVDYECRVASMEKGSVVLTPVGSRVSETEIPVATTLYQAAVRGEKLELIIQKCVELGVCEINVVLTDNSVMRPGKSGQGLQWDEKKAIRYNKISEAAAKQSMRGVVPRVNGLITFEEAVARSLKSDLVFAPWEKERETGLRDLITGRSYKTAGFFIGPEGGFSERETGLFRENGIRTVTLGNRVLRTETAGLYVMAAMAYENS